mgnify:CR=1 FL=1
MRERVLWYRENRKEMMPFNVDEGGHEFNFLPLETLYKQKTNYLTYVRFQNDKTIKFKAVKLF